MILVCLQFAFSWLVVCFYFASEKALVSTIGVEVVMGVEDLVFSQNLDVFPSPTSSTIAVSLDGDIALSNNFCEIYSISGQKVMEFTLSQSEIDVSGLSNGTYLIIVDTERGLIRQSFIVAK